METYIGVKTISAKPMGRLEYNNYRGWELPADEDGSDEGYLVEYHDGGTTNHPDHSGYISWSPKAVFGRAYRLTQGMAFGQALEAIKQGSKIARKGWNGKNMFVYFVPAAKYPANRNELSTMADYADSRGLVQYNAYMAIKNVDGTVSTWVPSVNDCLAEDWELAT